MVLLGADCGGVRPQLRRALVSTRPTTSGAAREPQEADLHPSPWLLKPAAAGMAVRAQHCSIKKCGHGQHAQTGKERTFPQMHRMPWCSVVGAKLRTANVEAWRLAGQLRD